MVELINCGCKKNPKERLYFKVTQGDADNEFYLEKLYCRKCMKKEGLDT